MKIVSNGEIDKVLEEYPAKVKAKLEKLRKLIIESAEEILEITEIEKTLKWGEPRFLTKHGSTVRIDWK